MDQFYTSDDGKVVHMITMGLDRVIYGFINQVS